MNVANRFSGHLFVPSYDSLPINKEKKTLIPYVQWRIQRVHCRRDVRNQIGAKRRRGRVREVGRGGGSGASPGKIFEKKDANGAF